MTRFGFIVHPLTAKDAARKYPIARFVPDAVIELTLTRLKPVVMGRASGIESATGAKTEGIFIACPMTPRQMLQLPIEFVYEKIAAAVNLAADEGAEVVGLGAFTSVVGDGGVTIADRARVPVTTGNSYTVAAAIDGLLRACELVGIESKGATLAVVGATGSIGRTCAVLLRDEFANTIAIGRDEARTRALASELGIESSTRIEDLQRADAVVTVTSSGAAIIEPQHLKPGSVVCDVARPRDVSTQVATERADVLVIEGGVVRVPGQPDFGFNFGFPPHTAYACMAETMLLALEGRPESFTLGKNVTTEQVTEIREIAAKHGFVVDGLRSFERLLDQSAIDRVREKRRSLAAV